MHSPDMEPLSSVVSMEDHDYTAQEVERFIQDLRRSKQEVDVARRQFDTVTDPLLVDHIVFRLGAAEKRLNYLIQLAKKLEIEHEGMSWLWYEED